MSVGFFDTNILVYATDPADRAKQDRALDLIGEYVENAKGVISTQVLQEYFVTMTVKKRLDPAEAQKRVELYIESFKIVRITEHDIMKAIHLHRLDAMSFWDSLIVTAATNVKAGTLYTEDMQNGRRYGSLEIVNPFQELTK
jgi:predicted nucleic acid-binding protein